MRTLIASLVFVLFICGFANGQTDKRVESIRKLAQEADRKIAECEANGDTSTTFLTEVKVNRNNGPYPAVGIFDSTVKIYYTFGDREKNPYPDRLLKAIVTTHRSSRTEISELLFDASGALVFFYRNADEREVRIYYDRGKVFRIMNGDKPLTGSDASQNASAAASLSRQIVAMFRNSLEL